VAAGPITSLSSRAAVERVDKKEHAVDVVEARSIGEAQGAKDVVDPADARC
jgi:hypothetical protein